MTKFPTAISLMLTIWVSSAVLGETSQSVSAAHFLSGECDNKKVSVEACGICADRPWMSLILQFSPSLAPRTEQKP